MFYHCAGGGFLTQTHTVILNSSKIPPMRDEGSPHTLTQEIGHEAREIEGCGPLAQLLCGSTFFLIKR